LLITGKVKDYKIKEQFLASTQVTYYGILQYDEALSIIAATDVVLILYDPSIQMSQYRLAGCNRLCEAMMFGKPIITNIYDEYVFKKMRNCIKVQYSKTSIRDAILFLINNPKERVQLGLKGKLLAKKEYNWEEMERTLINAYKMLTMK